MVLSVVTGQLFRAELWIEPPSWATVELTAPTVRPTRSLSAAPSTAEYGS